MDNTIGATRGIQGIFHPALLGLLRAQTAGKIWRCFASFKSPRKRALAVLCLGLASFWLVNILVAVIFRSAADLQRLMVWIPFSLLSYSVWHLIKTVSRKPTVPFDWTPAEDELVRTAPVSRKHLISYRLTSIFSAGILKATCFAIVMTPDLPFWLIGLIGMFLGLVFVDLLRVCIELVYHGLDQRTQTIIKAIVLTSAIGIAARVFSVCFSNPEAVSQIDSPGSLVFVQAMFNELISLGQTPLGIWLTSPFVVFANLMFAESLSTSLAINAFVGMAMVAGLSSAIVVLDQWAIRQNRTRSKRLFENALALQNESSTEALEDKKATSKVAYSNAIADWLKPNSAMAAIAWRQLLGAWHYRTTLLVSLGLPTILCSLPLFSPQTPVKVLLQTVGALVFYSFVLLPSALILDFRRDINRMFVLKALPLSPLKVTLGQLAAPVILCSLFQFGVLAIATIVGSVVAWQALIAGVLLLPINALIFALENYIFLLAPFQRQKEGFDVFIRTILTFTGKSLLFLIALVTVFAWAMISQLIARVLGGSQEIKIFLLAAGIWMLAALLSVVATGGLVLQFKKFDCSQDVPSES